MSFKRFHPTYGAPPNSSTLAGRIKVEPAADSLPKSSLSDLWRLFSPAIITQSGGLAANSEASGDGTHEQENSNLWRFIHLWRFRRGSICGRHVVDMDEELIQGLSFPAYRRVLTVIHLPEKSGNRALTRMLTTDPNDLEAALRRDRDSTEIPTKKTENGKLGALSPHGTSKISRCKHRLGHR